MFNMESAGRVIAQARKKKNMTQPELADRLGISFQAVSNWERGLSMPDISKLPELAELLGLTIDEILGGPAPLLDSAAQGGLDDYLTKNEVTPEALAQAAPLLKPAQMETVVKNCRPPLDFSQLRELLPFLSREDCDAFLRQAAEAGDARSAAEIAPFAGRAAVDDVVARYAAANQDFRRLLPFASPACMERLIGEIFERQGIGALNEFFPFAPKPLLVSIAERAAQEGGLGRIAPLAPFLDRDTLDRLARQAVRKEGIRAVEPIAPFLGSALLRQLIEEAAGRP